MNREQAKQLLPIIQAFADGEDVQAKSCAGWRDTDEPAFHHLTEYRIKPKLLEGWAVVWPNGGMSSIYTSREIPDQIASNHAVERVAKFREVTK